MIETSVIIRTRTGEPYLGFAIQSVLDHVPNSEIIIVDNACKDGSLDTALQFNKADIQIFPCDQYSPGKALNIGIKESVGKKILILSAHAKITKYDSSTIDHNLEQMTAVFGKQIPVYRGKRITPRYIWSHFIEHATVNMFSQIENRPFFHNAFAVYNGDYLRKHLFDEDLSGKEDRYWAKDVIDRGDCYLYNPIVMECEHYWTPSGATWQGIG